MTLQRRLAILAGTAVALAVAAASIGLYVSVRGALRNEIDRSLQERLEALQVDRLAPQPADARPAAGPSPINDPLGDQPYGGTEVFAQVISASLPSAIGRSGDVTLPFGERERAVAARQEPAFFTDAEVGGQHLRILTGSTRPGLAVQLARPLDELDATLGRLTLILAAFTAAGLLLGGVFGRIVAGSATRPIRRLGLATRRVRSTLDLSARVEAGGRDELAELAQDFNAMLEALEASQRSQRQLVADASHELRTPVTSLRTYLEYLRREDGLPDDERDEVLGEAVDQVEELAALVSDLVELARGEHQELTKEPVRLDLLVGEAVERARRRAPSVALEPHLEPTTVAGSPDLLLRAVNNLLDNAVKWSAPGGIVEIATVDGAVIVRDFGPGFAAEDLPHVFDRFYRSLEARKLPGSGLGLAIVKHVAEAHRGTVTAANAPGGGAVLTLDLAGSSLDVPDLLRRDTSVPVS
jgi:two-component system, OmpR family, sensor histidine kinase MprB